MVVGLRGALFPGLTTLPSMERVFVEMDQDGDVTGRAATFHADLVAPRVTDVGFELLDTDAVPRVGLDAVCFALERPGRRVASSPTSEKAYTERLHAEEKRSADNEDADETAEQNQPDDDDDDDERLIRLRVSASTAAGPGTPTRHERRCPTCVEPEPVEREFVFDGAAPGPPTRAEARS